MQRSLPHLPAIARAAGLALVAIAVSAAALRFHAQSQRVGTQQVTPTVTADPLAAELKRCEHVAAQAKDDPACEKAWAENRRRFSTYAPLSAPTHAVPAQNSGR